MRKNSPRKWLHAILDLLPVILIPVFMIYSHRHTIDSYSVTRQEKINNQYNFYQHVKNGQPVGLNYINLDSGDDIGFNDEYLQVQGTNYFDFHFDTDIELAINDKIYLSFTYFTSSSGYYNCTLYDSEWNDEFLLVDDDVNDTGNDVNYSEVFDVSNTSSFVYLSFNFHNEDEYADYSEMNFKNVQLFNLTTIFGTGNEPTKDEFESMLTQDYYNYGNNYFDNYVTISKTYNDTDIMSQFTYNLYNSVDKYFNMNNVFGMNNVYAWFESNIFHGTAPLYIYIVWNIVLYEFVMDLLMLLYSLFMWFIDMCQNLIDRCYTSSKGGN